MTTHVPNVPPSKLIYMSDTQHMIGFRRVPQSLEGVLLVKGVPWLHPIATQR